MLKGGDKNRNDRVCDIGTFVISVNLVKKIVKAGIVYHSA